MVYAPREWTCSPDFTQLFGDRDPRTPGEPLSGPWFPQLFPR